MKLRLPIVEALLKPAGFEVGLETGYSGWCFVRPDSRAGLFQVLVISFAGRAREAVTGRVWISILHNFVATGLSEHQFLPELGPDTWCNRGQSVIETRKAGAEWERRFATVAPGRAEALAAEKGSDLLARTALVRGLATRFLDRLPPAESVYAQIMGLRRLRPDLAKPATWLSERPGVLGLSGTEEVCELACLCLLVYKDDVVEPGDPIQEMFPVGGSGGKWSFSHSPSRPRDELRYLIQLLVDRLIDFWNDKEGSGLALAPQDWPGRRWRWQDNLE